MFFCKIASQLSGLRCSLLNFRLLCLSNSSHVRVKSRVPLATNVSGPNPRVPVSLIARCGLFTLFAVPGIFTGSVIWEYERWRTRKLQSKLGRRVDTDDIWHRVRKKFESMLGRPFRATDVFWAIVACNLLVFVGHRSPIGPKFFTAYFLNSPYGPTPALSMLLSVFSHHSLVHLGINMYVLHSFAMTLVDRIGPGEFLSLFVAGGIFSSFLSLLSKICRLSAVPSLGASGGVCAVLGAFCMFQPHAYLCVPFVVHIIPHSFQAHNAAWTLLGLELLASVLLVNRSPIDHAAHFGGLAFGMYYGLLGSDSIWRRRTATVYKWTEWRGDV